METEDEEEEEGGGERQRACGRKSKRDEIRQRLTFSPSGLVLQPPWVRLPGDCSRALHPSPGFVLETEPGRDDETKEQQLVKDPALPRGETFKNTPETKVLSV